MSASFWTAVASRTRHRFRTRGNLPDALAFSCARKRRRRCALPAHFKACGTPADTSAMDQEIDEAVYTLYGLTPAERDLVEESAKK